MFALLAAIAIAVTPTGILKGPRRPGENIEQIVIQGVARICSGLLDAETTVGGVEWDRANQRLTLRDVRIANPEGFSAGDAIAIETAEVEADLRSLLSDSPEVRLIHVGGATINAETSLRGNNLKKLMDNAKSAVPGGMRKQRLMPQRDKRWRIDQVKVDQSAVNVSMPLLGGKPKRYTLDKYETSFVGPNGAGMSAQEILVKTLRSLLDRVPASDTPENQPEPEQQSPAGALLDILLQPQSPR